MAEKQLGAAKEDWNRAGPIIDASINDRSIPLDGRRELRKLKAQAEEQLQIMQEHLLLVRRIRRSLETFYNRQTEDFYCKPGLIFAGPKGAPPEHRGS